ncbi:MAG TPA: HAD family hydrolase [Marmoricola sp.]|jgi:phosphoglycolate phosphatase-like HAD superfamily hydrolase|nr:HAD family hydrolase [Marmoricola sp.]
MPDSVPDAADARYDTVVLDVDGTLVDSNYQHAVAWAIAFRSVGVAVPTWRLHRAIGMGADRLVAHVAGQQVEEGVGDEIRRIHEQEYHALHHLVTGLPGAESVIGELHQRGFKVALATSSSAEDFERETELFEDAHAVEAAITLPDVDHTKPAPDLLEVALREAGGSAGVTVGDSVWDMESAGRAGQYAIGVLSGGFGEHELRAAGADEVFAGVAELLEHLDETVLRGAARPEPQSGGTCRP